jgi:tetratricopeptide (TPR) repeat protein
LAGKRAARLRKGDSMRTRGCFGFECATSRLARASSLTALGLAGCALAVLGATGPALAQYIGQPAPEVKLRLEGSREDETTFFIREARGRVLVLFFWRSTSPESIEAFSIINAISKKYRDHGVYLVSVAPEKKEAQEKVRKDKDLQVTGYVYGPGWADLYAVMSFPYAFIIDPMGIVAWKGHPEDDLDERIAEQLQRTPPIGADQEALEAKLKLAEELKAKSEYARAYTLARFVEMVTDKAPSDTLHQKAKSLQDRLVEDAKKWIEDARKAQRAGEYAKACRIVAEISVRFATEQKEGPVRDLVADADTEIGRLRGANETKDMADRAVDLARGELKNEEAADLEAARDYLGALKIYRGVAEDYQKVEAGKVAQAAIDRIAKDPKIQAAIRDARARQNADRMLAMAERFTHLKMPDEARETYDRILREHPRTPAADRARRAVAKLPQPAANDDKPSSP